MAKASPAITSFNAGEFSPLLEGRFDIQKYANAASVLENFIPTVQGPLKKRPGTKYVGSSKNNAPCILIPFEYSATQVYVIELGERYARFYTTDSITGARGILLDPDGNPVEQETPYTLDDILNLDGSVRIRYAQAADVLYICSPSHPVQLLKRVSATSFVFEPFEFKKGPFEDLNDKDDTWVYSSGVAGTVNITSNKDIFTPQMVGGLFFLENSSTSAVEPWEPDRAVWPGTLRRSNGCYYVSKTWAYTGTLKPVHTEGDAWDGPREMIMALPYRMIGVKWQFSDPGYGHVEITRFIDSKTVEAVVRSKRLPNHVVGIGNKTTRWAHGSWSHEKGYPTSVAFFRSRLWFAHKQKVWASVVEDFQNFEAKIFGEVTADLAVSLTLASGQVNDIQWLLPDKDLIAGTAGGEFSIGELTNGSPLGPNNIRAILQSQYGSKSIQPIKNGSDILFMQRAGLKARELSYSIGADGYASTDATIMAEHITMGQGRKLQGENSEPAYGVIHMAFTQEPNPIVWMLRTDKQLIGFTWNNEQEVRGWHRHSTAGEVETFTVIPAFEGDHDELWLCIKRIVNGQEKRYIEYMADVYHEAEDQANQFYVDSGLSYKGFPASTIRGLEHLEGEEVAILADGAVHGNQVVRGGSVRLLNPARTVQIGLPFLSVYRSMRIEAGAADGTSQGKTKRINKVAYRLLNTGAAQYGVKQEGLDSFNFRKPNDPMGVAPPLFSGDQVVDFPGDYDGEGYIMFASQYPCAATLVGIYPQIITQDR